MPRWRYTVTDPVPTHCCALQRYKHLFKSKQYEQNYFISERKRERKRPLQTLYRRLLCRVACLARESSLVLLSINRNLSFSLILAFSSLPITQSKGNRQSKLYCYILPNCIAGVHLGNSNSLKPHPVKAERPIFVKLFESSIVVRASQLEKAYVQYL